MQRALLQFKIPKNYNAVRDALIACNRQDLIGKGSNCLIGDREPKNSLPKQNTKNKKSKKH